MFIKYNYFGEELVDWDIENFCGYKPMTTYFTDFSIADRFGKNAILDTLKRAKKLCKEMGYKWQTELAMVLNWKSWQHHGEGHREYTELYTKLFNEYVEEITNSLTDEELRYYYQTTD